MNAQEILATICDIAAWGMGIAFLFFMICVFTHKKWAVEAMRWTLIAMVVLGAIAILTHIIRLIIG